MNSEEEPTATIASFSAASRYPETARLIPEMKLLTSKYERKCKLATMRNIINLNLAFVVMTKCCSCFLFFFVCHAKEILFPIYQQNEIISIFFFLMASVVATSV